MKYHITVLRPATRGKNKRGVCAYKRTKGARHSASRGQLQTGYAPKPVAAYHNPNLS